LYAGTTIATEATALAGPSPTEAGFWIWVVIGESFLRVPFEASIAIAR
jgi:hypothetical protein